MNWASITRSWKGLGGGANLEAERPIRRLSPLSLLLLATGWAFEAPGLPALAVEAALPWGFARSPPHLPVQLERAIHSRPAGWMAPTSCPANVGCLPSLLSDSTISQWHPGTHRTSRKNDVLQKQTHAARLMVTLEATCTMKPWTFLMASDTREPGTSSAVKITSPLQAFRSW